MKLLEMLFRGKEYSARVCAVSRSDIQYAGMLDKRKVHPREQRHTDESALDVVHSPLTIEEKADYRSRHPMNMPSPVIGDSVLEH